jgi:4-amino-4-deoxy-L-arabinose transferase-like glycosyltransferase
MLDSKLPGLYTLYGLFTTLFGYHASGVHMGLLIANAGSVVCLYFLVKDLFNPYVARIASSFFLFLVISLNVVGFATHATQLLTPFVLGGSLLFWRGIQTGKLFLFLLAGLLIGIAFTIKQQAAIYGIVLAALWWPARWMWYKKENARLPLKEWLVLGIGGFLPLAAVVGYFGLVGRLDEFYNWTVQQPFNLAGSFSTPRYKLFLNAVPRVLNQFEGVWILAGAGLFLIFISGWKKEAPWFGILFSLAGILSVAIGAAYYQHYFILAMPGVALLAACSLYFLAQKTGRIGPWLGMSVAVILIVISMRGRLDYYFNPDFSKIHFDMYKYNLFPELEKVGQALAKRVPEGERIGIMGSEPEVLVAAGRENCAPFRGREGKIIYRPGRQSNPPLRDRETFVGGL